MNIYAFDADPTENARAFTDHHIRFGLMYYARLLCNPFYSTPLNSADPIPLAKYTCPVSAYAYTQTDWHHRRFLRQTEWVNNKENYKWLLAVGAALLDEYTFRTGRDHKLRAAYQWIVSRREQRLKHAPTALLLNSATLHEAWPSTRKFTTQWTPTLQLMYDGPHPYGWVQADHAYLAGTLVAAIHDKYRALYRIYLRGKRTAKWSVRGPPKWWDDSAERSVALELEPKDNDYAG